MATASRGGAISINMPIRDQNKRKNEPSKDSLNGRYELKGNEIKSKKGSVSSTHKNGEGLASQDITNLAA